MIVTEISAWAYLNKELTELKSEFESEFRIELIRDYENDWEWIWNGQESLNRINVSREHNWKNGEYSKPLRINLSWSSKEFRREELVKKIQNGLKSDLYFGTISNRGISLDDYKVTLTIKYET